MEANKLKVLEKVSASKALGRADAVALAKRAKRVVVAKGKQVREFAPGGAVEGELIDAMLGSTGNLRAPLIQVGKTILVGFNQDAFEHNLGATG